MIAIHYFASIREALDCEHENIDLPDDVKTVEQLISYLIKKHGPPWADVLGAGSLMIAVNHEMTDSNAVLDAGDEVAFFPPVTGG
ncbi:MAG: molybdopterin converting factor subunit 1 [Gammaproteobacteria bacterium]|jgi:molybdopterin synthase sulfur carrier subunit|nr:molybdopterin converting factor subunit 1 [Gammaproteobacteria bacterium]MBT6042168.1 molybdopterin converting factor subunit 1 [Gammaproteobacteria bacterium]